MKIAIIPARGGSVRIPNKNIREFCGKPMIAWSIEAALQSNLFDKVIVSTDSDQIAKIAEEYGAIAPFRRPKELSDEYATTRQVVQHAIDWISKHESTPEHVCCLYATAPFVTPSNLYRAYQQLIDSKKNFCFSVADFPYPIQRAMFKNESGDIEMLHPEHRYTRSQDLVETFHDAGQFYWGRAQAFIDNLPTFSEHSTPFTLERHQVQDIDTEADWKFAELLFTAHAQSNG
ncbi:pseudaminic acid cytidylyltransferase [Vibrio fortis]|uniref:Pseudaminic acid cytidylyltransferase n=1 Tax=Vibrio fortis TaxID=212667 RepID=A0A5N3QZQ7_9VIBR|nr:pseudaminic acid cytidylyltransferase [Vibrio fortis]KAB0287460.1 pseudaminic acid cytidylyltransferase [Vibrio fortis]